MSINAFDVLGVGCRLGVGDEELRSAYDRRAAEQHPDVGGGEEAFAQLREAREMLRSPGRRLRHWLELGGVDWEAGGEVPAELLELFGEVGDLVMRVDGLLARRTDAQSALGRSLLERDAMERLEGIEEMRSRVGAMRERESGRFAEFDEAGAKACGDQAVETARTLLFLEKWDAQLRERWARLAG